jgi:hypothetical protein
MVQTVLASVNAAVATACHQGQAPGCLEDLDRLQRAFEQFFKQSLGARDLFVRITGRRLRRAMIEGRRTNSPLCVEPRKAEMPSSSIRLASRWAAPPAFLMHSATSEAQGSMTWKW